MCSLFSWHSDVKAAARLVLFPSLLASSAARPAKPRHSSSSSPLQSGLRFSKLIKCIDVYHARPGVIIIMKDGSVQLLDAVKCGHGSRNVWQTKHRKKTHTVERIKFMRQSVKAVEVYVGNFSSSTTN